MNKLVILPYTVSKGKMNSLSAKSISKHFNGMQIWPNRNYTPKNNSIVINWGYSGNIPVLDRSAASYKLLNNPTSVGLASNKIECLKALRGSKVSHVNFCETIEEAKLFIDKGFDVYCRTLISSREGKGIVVAKTKEDLVECKLYTRKFTNNAEFRVHVFNDEVIDIVEKQRMSEKRMAELGVTQADLSDEVRNRKKGWSFNRDNIVIPDNICNLAKNAVKALGLDFAAVDIIHNTKNGQSAVLEVNTAPGQSKGTDTHFRYVEAITRYIGGSLTKEEYELKYNCKLKYGKFNG